MRLFVRGAFAAALPLLILAIRPLSMIGMMYLMRGGQGAASAVGAGAGKESPAGSVPAPREVRQ